LGEDNLNNLHGFDIIFKTPAMRPDLPAFVIEKNNGAVLTSEMEVFINMCQAKIFAVTGSDGKTTTTTLIGEMLKKQGYKVWVGGNIGTPLFDKLDEIEKEDMVVLELGSFQLQTISEKSPNISVITNISPNHLDFHTDMQEYIWSKQNIYRHQNSDDKLILNYDNNETRAFSADAKGKVSYFSRKNEIRDGAYLLDGKIYINGEYLFDAKEIKLLGDHNKENFLAAICAVDGFVEKEAVLSVARNFSGVEHRIEFVKEVNGVKFYNDSIGSSPTRTIASISIFDQKVILIAGGYDKKIPYDIMGQTIIDKVKGLIVMGQTGPQIKKALDDRIAATGNGRDIVVEEVKYLEEAVRKAYKMAVPGDIVVLSPASASYDMFPNFEIRGKLFKEIVKAL
ncbi:MAG: UDP-N-acetylmuramoyl-L-alanine--D-glutamate ligase, partial [Clostridia bacterium]|nr:UDP-N-acetylmuramoyl-L-alanine--D-glutamate ligase [Clostridia bacterium]